MTGRTALASAVLLALLGAGCGGPPDKPLNIDSSEKSSSKPEDKAPKGPADKDKAGPAPTDKDKAGDKDKGTPADKPPANPEVTLTKDAGVIRGEVLRGGAGVGDVVVWIQSPPPDSPPPAGAVAIAVRKGVLRPHVAVARKDSAVRLSAGDDADDFLGSGAAAFSCHLDAGQSASQALPRVGLVEIKPQRHPEWGTAYVHVFDHGFAAVTGPDGKFTLPAVAPGEPAYTVTLWYEGDAGAAPETRKLSLPKLAADEGAALKWKLDRPPPTRP
jgi:hypothetical protein